MSIFIQDSNTILFQRTFINTKSGFQPPEYVVGVFVNQYLKRSNKQNQHEKQMPPSKINYSIEDIYDMITLERPRNKTISLSEVSANYNNLLNIMNNKENIFIVQYYPLHAQIQKLQTLCLEEILLLFWIMNCQITIQEAYKKIEITYPQYDFQNKTQDNPQLTQRQKIENSKYSLLSLFKHLLQQPQYQQQEFQLEQLYSDLFLTPIVLQQNYQNVDGILERGKQNEQMTQLKEFREKIKIDINQYDISRLQKQVDKYLRSEQSITQYNLMRNPDTGLYIVANPYNLTSQSGLQATLQKYVIKKNNLTQFTKDVDNLNKLAVYFVLNKQNILLDADVVKKIEVVSFNMERLRDEYLQIRRQFCFSTQQGQVRQQKITPSLRNNMLQVIKFQKGQTATIERQTDVGIAVQSKSNKWLNDHISASWYLEKRERLTQQNQGQRRTESDSEDE